MRAIGWHTVQVAGSIGQAVTPLLIALGVGWWASPLQAEIQFELDLPVVCVLGENCAIQNYFDRDPGPGYLDYHCGSLSYDGHHGTDFRVKTFQDQQKRVDVVAAREGRVKAVRDGIEDGPASGQVDRGKIRDHMAGNGVVLDHGQGWETQYSHLRKGSIGVVPGQLVQGGQKLGLIGQSGLAEFPHVDFSVRFAGQPVDPFAFDKDFSCQAEHRSLWSAKAKKQLAYLPVGELSAGFAMHVPDDAYVANPPIPSSTLWSTAPRMIFWVNLFGVRNLDRETIRLLDPTGHVLAEHSTTHSKHQARFMRYIGKKGAANGQSWPVGTYRGEYALFRDNLDQPVLLITRELQVAK